MSTESRFYDVEAVRIENGRSQQDIRCPFCGCLITAYLWSLAGTGKLCECGAKLVFQPPVALKEK